MTATVWRDPDRTLRWGAARKIRYE